MARRSSIKFVSLTTENHVLVEGLGEFSEVPPGHISVTYPSKIKEIKIIDDLPDHWIEQLRQRKLGKTD